jgi:hypothetical protein
MMSCGLRPIDAVIIQIESTSQSGKKSTQKYKCGLYFNWICFERYSKD